MVGSLKVILKNKELTAKQICRDNVSVVVMLSLAWCQDVGLY